jgi:hypothetical protein
MVHYTLRTDLPAFFGKQMTADIYAADILFEESVSSIGLSCHGHPSYLYGLYKGSGVRAWDFWLDMQHWCRRLLGGLRRLGRALLRSPRVDVHSCVAHDAHGEVHVRWSVRGTWRLLGRPYALEAMSVYVVNDRGQVAYHRYACRVAMAMAMVRVMVRECRLNASCMGQVRPGAAGHDAQPRTRPAGQALPRRAGTEPNAVMHACPAAAVTMRSAGDDAVRTAVLDI